MIYGWIFVIVFPIVLLIQLLAQRKAVKKQGQAITIQHVFKAFTYTIILTIVAYVAYFLGLVINA